jgi:hypothetical protein
MPAEITGDRYRAAAIHLVQGPNYALEVWAHTRILYLDRCFYDSTEKYASIGWRTPNGAIDFKNQNSDGNRWAARYLPWKYSRIDKALILADYGNREIDLYNQVRGLFTDVEIRRHPADQLPGEPLSRALQRADVVIGRTSTALVDAVLAGVPTICLDQNHIARAVSSHNLQDPLFRGSRRQWVSDLSYTQWTAAEMASGRAWRHLIDSV